MTARSKGQRIKNRKVKAEKLKHREIKRLQKIVNTGKEKSVKEMMEIVGGSENVDEKKLEEIKKVKRTDCKIINQLIKLKLQKKTEETIKSEFIAEKREEIEKLSKKRNKKKMKITNDNTGLVHDFNTKTLKDQYGSYPPWLNIGNYKRKLRRKKAAVRKNQFYTGANTDYCA